MALDPTTSRPLPDSAIQRVVFVAPNLHVYTIPPLSSNRGFSASSWTSPTQPTAKQIFTARLRVFETSIDDHIKCDIVLEDPSSGELFAAAPYANDAVVQQASDSSRFFAVRVQAEGGMKATLGMGFEERTQALDFNIALGEIRKVLGFESGGARPGKAQVEENVKQDWSLKEGEKLHIEVGGKGQKASGGGAPPTPDDGSALFSIAPPPGAAKAQGSVQLDSTQMSTHKGDVPTQMNAQKTAQDFGFDDGEFGEFQ